MTRINTNVTSMMATRVLNNQQEALNTSLERLSTGLKINSGSDDPAGLIASEVLRGEQTALSAAIANSERASNVIATAEGALNEVSSLLTQLQDSVASAANISGQSSDEVAAKQLQVDSILSTINRIANSTDFEGVSLLNGSLDYTTTGADLTKFDDVSIKSASLVDGADKTVTVEVIASAELASVAGTNAVTGDNVTLQITGNNGTQVFSFGSAATVANVTDAVTAASDLTGVAAIVSGGTAYFKSTEYGENSFVKVDTIDGTYANGDSTGADATVAINGQTATTDGLTATLNTADLSVTVVMTAATGTAEATSTFDITGGGATFSLGADVMTGRASIGIQSVTTGSIGSATDGMLSSIGDGQANSLSSDNLGKAQDIVEAAIVQVASLRGRLGSFQSLTIDSSINSMNVALENTAAAESAIRDADFATETANMTRSQILVQAATTVLKTANSAPQTALSLLG
jgi:flagellin